MNNIPLADEVNLLNPPRNLKELILYHHHMLDDCLPDKLRGVSSLQYKPDAILRRIDKLQKELDELKSLSVKDLAATGIQDHYANPEKHMEFIPSYNESQKKEYETMLTQLKGWKPNSKAAKTLRKNLITHLSTLFNHNISSPFDIPELFTATKSKKQILDRKNELTLAITDLKKKYPLSIEYQEARKKYETDLMKDLELL